jgi:hypothetical protein
MTFFPYFLLYGIIYEIQILIFLLQSLFGNFTNRPIFWSNRCNIVEAHAWTHNDCLACVAKISSDEPTSPQINDPNRLATIKDHLSTVLHSGGVKARFLGCNGTVGLADAERRLHQLMFAGRDFDRHYYSEISVGKYDLGEGRRTVVSVDGCNEKRYSVVNVECLDRPRLMFDTVCTLADLHYVVFHASISSHGPFASQVCMS